MDYISPYQKYDVLSWLSVLLKTGDAGQRQFLELHNLDTNPALWVTLLEQGTILKTQQIGSLFGTAHRSICKIHPKWTMAAKSKRKVMLSNKQEMFCKVSGGFLLMLITFQQNQT
jgi:photosystem II stability/assembly factor-like uncharacterized protein